jgi:hypothetical protein
MTTFGLSYSRGIFYHAPQLGIAHATLDRQGRIQTHFFPWSVKGMLFLVRRVLTTLPLYMYGLMAVLLLLCVMPDWWALWPLPAVPAYSMLLLALGYHFFFPLSMRRFHGAEHKVFSYRGPIHIRELSGVQQANIVNRGCSTNTAVLFFLVFLLAIPFVNGWMATGLGVLALILVPRFWKWCDRCVVFPISAWLQKKVTTAEPEEIHVKIAILSYMSLKAGKALSEEEAWEEANY